MPSKNELKLLRSLQQKKGRQLHRLFMVEGTKSVLELLQSDYEIEGIYATEKWQLQNPGITISGLQTISERECLHISNWQNPAGILACAHTKDPSLLDLQKMAEPVLVLDGIQDPGNFGTIIRTADWFGIRQIVCSPNTVELHNPKCIQASMGSFTRVNIQYTDLKSFIETARQNYRIYGTFMDGEPLQEVTFEKKSILIIGSEPRGISPELEPLVNRRICIPKKADHAVDSLNASIASAIFCYEMTKK